MSKKVLGFASVILLLMGAFYLVQAQSTAQNTTSALPHLTSVQYARANGGDIYVMLVGMESCRPCRMAEKLVFVPLAERYQNVKQIRVVKVDMEEERNTPANVQKIEKIFGITVSPTMLVVQRGQVLWRKDGFGKEEQQAVTSQIIRVVDSLK